MSAKDQILYPIRTDSEKDAIVNEGWETKREGRGERGKRERD